MMAGGQIQDFSTAAKAVLRLIQDRLEFEVSWVSRRQGDQYVILDCLGGERMMHAGDVLPWSETFCSLMMAGEPSLAPVLDDVPAYAALRDRAGLPLRAVMSVPIVDRQGGLFGTLCGLSTTEKPQRILVEEPTVRLWADLLGLVLSNELAVDQQAFRAARAEREAETDPLTGLGNRRLWDRLLGLEEERCRRYGSAASVVIVDLDDLKAINDELGHAAGDAHLGRVGRCLRSVLPAQAQAARVGGDEFAILATECDQAGGEDFIRMVRRALDEAGISASIGLGVRTLDVDMTGAWRQADREMYRAKRRARSLAGRRSRRVADVGGSFGAERMAQMVTTSAQAADQIDELLLLTRQHLDSDVAMVAEIRDGRWIVRHVSARVDGWDTGVERDAEETYCRLLLNGQIPDVIPDTSLIIDGPDLAWLKSPVGSYLGVPLAMDGRNDAGTLCCFSAEPDLSLNGRDSAFLRLVARMVTDLFNREQTAAQRQRTARLRVEQARMPDALQVVFQPIVELASGRTVGLEALTRLPTIDDLGPSLLYQAAEDAGATVELELFAAGLATAGLVATDGYLAVNFSATTMLDPGFDRFLADLPVERIVIEISEHTRVEDYEVIERLLQPLRAGGLRVAVDDAGAGFASFQHVLRLRPDIIKLDISLVRNVAKDGLSQRLAAALAGVGQQIDAQVVAEGIEDEETLVALQRLGVGYGQGYYLGHPVPLAHLAR